MYCVRLSCILNEYVIGRIMRMLYDKFFGQLHTRCIIIRRLQLYQNISLVRSDESCPASREESRHTKITVSSEDDSLLRKYTFDYMYLRQHSDIRVVFYPRHVTQQNLVVTPCLPVRHEGARSEAMLAPSTFSASWRLGVSLSLHQITECWLHLKSKGQVNISVRKSSSIHWVATHSESLGYSLVCQKHQQLVWSHASTGIDKAKLL